MSSSPRVNLPPPIDQRISVLIEGAIEQAVCQPHVPIVCSVPFLAFVNRIRIMLMLEKEELVDADVIDSQAEWLLFEREPWKWLCKASDPKAAALWLLTERLQPPELRSPPAVEPSAPAQIGEAA